MRPTLSDVEFWSLFRLISVEVENAFIAFHSFEELKRLAIRDAAILRVLQEDSLFWRVYRSALETTMFMTQNEHLRRKGSRRDAKNNVQANPWLDLLPFTMRTKMYACLCCGFKTLTEQPLGSFEICPVCFWEDDAAQASNSSLAGGANKVSLSEARKNFLSFGASSRDAVKSVRRPLAAEGNAEDTPIRSTRQDGN